MSEQGSFSERHGYVRPREIVFRDDLPEKLRLPLIEILRQTVSASFLWERIEYLFNRYGIEDWPPPGPPIAISKEEDNPDFIAAKRVLLRCEWFRLFDLIEDIFQRLYFHDSELRHEDEEPQAYPFQKNMNEYFEYAGIGWQIADGKVMARGDDAFERTVQSAQTELKAGGRPMAAERIGSAIRDLSIRPKPDLCGAMSHATAAVECVLHDITQQSMRLGEYIKKYPDLFPGAMKNAFHSLWGYASETARHGKEGVEPPREDAEFIVAVAAAMTTYLNRKRPRE